MKFALINGEKEEASKGAKGICPVCDSELNAKCGEVKINHWAHKGNRNCDPWWEKETDWHRAWKDKFPKEWQETVHFDHEHGEKHIADVKTSSGWCIEFQHSYLKPEERRSRNDFYGKLVWVVDGTSRQNDKKQFQIILSESTRVPGYDPIRCVRFPEECRLLREWHDNDIYVFFDFQEIDKNGQSLLRILFPKTSSGDTYIAPYSRQAFIDFHNNNKFDEIINEIDTVLAKVNNKNQIAQAINAHNLARRFPDPLAIKTTNTRRSRGRL